MDRFILAIINQNTTKVKNILKGNRKTDIPLDLHRALMVACQFSSPEIVHILLHDHRAMFDNNYIYAALIGDNVDVLDILLLVPGMYADNLTFRTAIYMNADKCTEYLRQTKSVVDTMW